MKTVVIFGVFDGIHDGHRAFIAQAREQGERLVAIVARDESVLQFKGKAPTATEVERINTLLGVPEIDLVLLGDAEPGTYKALQEVAPDIVFLGYDQQALFANIKKAIENKILPNIELVFGTPYKPETMHSSILNTDHESTN
jgi:cytidyltransferase-like protein